MDLFEKLRTNQGPLGAMAAKLKAHHYFSFPILEGEIGPYMLFQGRKMLNWGINDYLGLANHPEVRQADEEAAKQWGLAYPMGARLLSGNTDLHEQLERQLAAFVGKEAAFLLNFGYQGVMSAIDALVDHRDVIVYDAECHACLVDGVRLHRAKLGEYYKYNNNDMASLEKNLQRASKKTAESGGCILVVTESVFGMSGKISRLDEIVKLKEKYNFRLLVDDAHGFGVMGETGAGTGEMLSCQAGIDLYFATFAKSMVSIGAFIAGDKDIITYLTYNIRSQNHAKALPMVYVAGAIKRLELIKKHPELRVKLWDIAKTLQDGLRKSGFDVGETQSPVTPVYLRPGEAGLMEAVALVRDLREEYRIFCPVVVYPAVPKGVVLLRIIPTAAHTPEDVQYMLSAFTEINRKFKCGFYRQTDEKVPFTALTYLNEYSHGRSIRRIRTAGHLTVNQSAAQPLSGSR